MERRDFLGIAFNGAVLLPFGARFCWSDTNSSSMLADAQDVKSITQLEWALQPNPRAVPSWFEDDRVQAHTRLQRSLANTPEFINAAQYTSELGAHVLSRHFKSRGEPSWARTSPDRVRNMIDDAHKHGLRIIAYYWHMANDEQLRAHPEWACKDDHGAPSKAARGIFMDLASPYRDVVQQDLLQLAEMGVDGFFFDAEHLPHDGCFHSEIQREFQQVTGLQPPNSTNERDARFQQYMQFHAYVVEKAFNDWRNAVLERYPNVVFIISAASMPALIDRRLSTNLVRIADSAKHEFRLATKGSYNLAVFKRRGGMTPPPDDVRIALGWALMRDSANGRAPRIGAPDFATPDGTEAFAAAVVTWGGIANINLTEEHMPPQNAAGESDREGYRRAFALGNAVSPHLAGTKPLRWAAVHFSEIARNARGTDFEKAWREVLWPINGVFASAVAEGLPIGTIDDYQLEHNMLDGYEVLFIADRAALTQAQARNVAAFQSAGGTVLYHDSSFRWDDPGRVDNAESRMRDTLRSVASRNAPVIVKTRSGAHAVPFYSASKKRLVVAVTTDFTWIDATQSITSPEDNNRRDRRQLPPRGPAASDVVINVRADSGSATEVLTGQKLQTTHTNGFLQVRVPSFRTAAFVVFNDVQLP